MNDESVTQRTNVPGADSPGKPAVPGPVPSYVHGVSRTPLSGTTIGACLREKAAHLGDHEALVCAHQDVRMSYAELDRAATAWAAGLLSLGLEPGQRIGIWSANNWEWIVLQFATARAGLVLVNINPAYRLDELEYALRLTGCRALVTAPSFKTSDYIGMIRELRSRTRDDPLVDLEHLVVLGGEDIDGYVRFDSLGASPHRASLRALESIGERLQFDDPINIQFTSGTTGTPKAATLTHHNILNNALFSARAMEFTERDRLCIPVPMYHCFGMVLGSLLCVAAGATSVLASAGFDAHAALRAIDSERCTAVHGVPTMFIAMLDDPGFEEFSLTTLRTGIMAGAPCPEALMHRVIERMHLEQITIAYGMTETGPLSFQTSVDDPLERRVSTVGRVLPHVEVKIVDDEGAVVPRSTPGELLTRGYCVMRGYWNDPERTREAIDEAGWIASGDIAVLDDDGYCRIVGRSKDMLIRGGENIFPREIEEFLYTHPAIDAVEVFGVPDEKYGEVVAAWIRPVPGAELSADDVREFCRENIAHFKIPRFIKFVEEFPVTVTGKVKKYVMREAYAKELGRRDD